MIVNLFCRCGCGQQTARVDLPPGGRLKSRYCGVVTGHTPVHMEIIDSEGLAKRKEAAVLIKLIAGSLSDKFQKRVQKIFG